MVLWIVAAALSNPFMGVLALSPMSTNPVRISETPAGFGPDEKETALLTLRDWGLGSFRLFAELAGQSSVFRCLFDHITNRGLVQQGFSSFKN